MDDFIYICDDAYQQQQFIAMESRIIRCLGFDINIPIPYRFLRRYAKVSWCCLLIHPKSLNGLSAFNNDYYKSQFEKTVREHSPVIIPCYHKHKSEKRFLCIYSTHPDYTHFKSSLLFVLLFL